MPYLLMRYLVNNNEANKETLVRNKLKKRNANLQVTVLLFTVG